MLVPSRRRFLLTGLCAGLGTVSAGAWALQQRGPDQVSPEAPRPLASPAPAERAKPKPRGVAVVELFTSEGCSSCPPADRNLQRIASLYPDSDVIPLSFHVDYWNRLGWTDPFSHADFSLRQQAYAEVLRARQVFTPQMIVNGVQSLNGSDVKRSDAAIARALQTPARYSIELTLHSAVAGVDPQLNYQISPQAPEENATSAVLQILVVLDHASSNVARGENEGRQLSHAWVVRSLHSLPLTALQGEMPIDRSLLTPGHSRVVALIQSAESRAVLGAAATSF